MPLVTLSIVFMGNVISVERGKSLVVCHRYFTADNGAYRQRGGGIKKAYSHTPLGLPMGF